MRATPRALIPLAAGYRACLFDLDGTLVDSAPDLHATLNVVLEAAALPPVSETMVRRWVGRGARKLIEIALTHHRGVMPPADEVEALLAPYLRYYAAHIADRSVPYPGVRDTLDALRARGVRLACVTNKFEHLATSLLASVELGGQFQAVVGGDTAAARKPDPAPLRAACAALGVEPGESVMIGDSNADIDAARSVGCPVVCVRYGYETATDLEAAGADVLVDSLHALL